jgi:uncharacterized membrane protein YkoI
MKYNNKKMKKNTGKRVSSLAAAALLYASLPALAVSAASPKSIAASDYIGLEAAKKAALSQAGASSRDVTFLQTELDWEDDTAEYEIKFTWNNKIYDYEINADDGEITEYSVKKIKQKKAASKSDKSKASKETSGNIGIEKAKENVLKHAGYKEKEVTFTKSKLDKDDGKSIYEVEFRVGGLEYEYEVNAATGKIADYDIEEEDWD